VLPNFLSPDHLEGVRRECQWLDGHAEQQLTTIEGPTIQEVSGISRFGESALPRIYAFFRDPRLSGILQGSEKWRFGDLARYGIRPRDRKTIPRLSSTATSSSRVTRPGCFSTMCSSKTDLLRT
jgi:hypothetical protein